MIYVLFSCTEWTLHILVCITIYHRQQALICLWRWATSHFLGIGQIPVKIPVPVPVPAKFCRFRFRFRFRSNFSSGRSIGSSPYTICIYMWYICPNTKYVDTTHPRVHVHTIDSYVEVIGIPKWSQKSISNIIKIFYINVTHNKNQSHNIYIIIYTPTSLSTTCTLTPISQ